MRERGWRRLAGALLLTVMATGCAGPAPAPEFACGAHGTRPMLVATLFFGRGGVSDEDWRRFVDDTLTPAFPDGLTITDARGHWRSSRDHAIYREPTKVVVIAAEDTLRSIARIGEVIDAYKRRFHQISVGRTLERRCGGFD